MKTTLRKLELFNKSLWVVAFVFSLGTLIYGLISHHAFFGKTSMNIYSLLLQMSPPLISSWVVNADILVQWPSWLLMHLLPKDYSYGVVVFIQEFGYVFQGIISFSLLYFLINKYNRKNLLPSLLLIYVVIFSNTLMISSSVMLPVTVFIFAFYLLLIRGSDDIYLGVASILLGSLLVFQRQYLLVFLSLFVVAAWYRYKESATSKNKFIFIGTFLNLFLLILKIAIIHSQKIVDYNWVDEVVVQVCFLMAGMLYLLPLVYIRLTKNIDHEKINHSILAIWLLTGCFMLVAFSGPILREYFDDKLIAWPLIIFSILFSVLVIMKKRFNPVMHGCSIAIALISSCLFIQFEPINFIRNALFSTWNKLLPHSYIQVLSLITIFLIQFLIIKEKLKIISKVALMFGSLVVLISVYRAYILYNLNIPLDGAFLDQGIYVVMSFLICIMVLLMEREKYQIKFTVGIFQIIMWLCPILLIVNTTYSAMKLNDWNWGVQNIKLRQLNKSGCLIIPKGLEQQQLTAVGITKDYIPFQSIMFIEERAKSSVAFFQDPTDANNSPCTIRSWGEDNPYNGFEKWGGEDSSWMIVFLRSRYLDFSSFAQQ